MVKSAVCGVSALTLDLSIGAQAETILPQRFAPNNSRGRYRVSMASQKRAAGDVIGGYTVVATLGRGGSGAVYKVRDGAGAEAALKLVDAGAETIAVQRLRREVEALQSLRHPAVPRVLDAEFEDEATFVVFELVPGASLFYYVQEHGPLRDEELAHFAETIASALEAVHAAGVVHRDVTPSNIMMGSHGPVLIDFGLAHRTDDERLTRDGLVSGTTGYVAPEVINGTEPGPVADIWAWAATVAFAMSGQAPFGTGTKAIGRTLESTPTLPEVVGAEALEAALSRDVESRPGMRDVVAALRGATETLEWSAAHGEEHVDPTLVGPGGTAVMTAAPQDTDAEVDEEFYLEARGDDDLDQDDSEQFETIPYPRERPRRPATIGMWSLVAAAGAALAPVISVAVVLLATVVARTAHRRAAALETLWERRGMRRSDAVVQTISLPWHLVRAVGEVIPAVLVALSLGVGMGALGWSMVDGGYFLLTLPQEVAWGRGAALAVGALVTIAVLWWGPWMVGTRKGAHRCAGTLAPTVGVASAWVVVALLGLAVIGVAVYLGAEPWWWPLPDAWTGTEGPITAPTGS